nr:Chain A, prion peptide [synthetic construct]4UBY_B Chain B, prion peptide [synthetic construct]4UBY_C Chain C, prion peptide [synthetic construct]4UBY_D Chain D, prion peptide [synthetic construct]
GGYVLG